MVVMGHLSRDPMLLVHLTTSARAVWLQLTNIGAVKCHRGELGNVTLGKLRWSLPALVASRSFSACVDTGLMNFASRDATFNSQT